MGKINGGRVVIGGLVAAVVIFLSHILFHVVFGERMMAAFDAILMHPMMQNTRTQVTFIVLMVVQGFLMVWLYAVARPRLGAGPRTAVAIGIVTGALTFMVPDLALVAITGVNPQILWIAGMWGVGGAIVATVAGAAIYQEA